MSQIVAKDLKKIYNPGQENEVRALDGVSFVFEEGELVVILGPSGAGKSTLLNLLGGMDAASSGELLVGGNDVAKMNQKALQLYRRKSVGYVFQFYNLMGNLTAIENVSLASSVVDDSADPVECLKKVGLWERKDNFPAQLSGGEQQRVSIARALAKNPSLLLCDEPTGALDSKTGASIISLLLDLSEQEKKTVVIVTHNAQIALCAHRVIRIRDGKIESDEKIASPKRPEEISW